MYHFLKQPNARLAPESYDIENITKQLETKRGFFAERPLTLQGLKNKIAQLYD